MQGGSTLTLVSISVFYDGIPPSLWPGKKLLGELVVLDTTPHAGMDPVGLAAATIPAISLIPAKPGPVARAFRLGPRFLGLALILAHPATVTNRVGFNFLDRSELRTSQAWLSPARWPALLIETGRGTGLACLPSLAG